MNDWIAMTINVGYFWLAVVIVRKLNLKILKDAFWSSIWAEIFLASIFLLIGLLLFDIPLGFFGYNNPERIAEMKIKWWVFPVGFLGLLLFSLSLKNSLESFRSEKIATSVVWKILLGSIFFGGGLVALLFVFGIKNSEMTAKEEQFYLDYWWAIWLVIGLLHLFLSALIKAVCQLFAWKKKMEQQANAPDMDGL